MSDFGLVIRGGADATACDTFSSDVAIQGGRIVAMGHDLWSAGWEIEAGGMLLLPGAIDAPCHIEQESSTKIMTADDYYSGSVSAVFGGNTTIITFAAQQRRQILRDVDEIAPERSSGQFLERETEEVDFQPWAEDAPLSLNHTFGADLM